MAQGLERRPSPVIRKAAIVALGAVALAWLWNRRGDAALRRRTADRLRPLHDRRAA